MIKSVVRHSLIKKGVGTLEVRGAVGVPSTNGNASGSFYAQILNKRGKGKACVIRRLGGIGDVLMCTPMLRQIKADFPELELTFAIDSHSTSGNVYYELVKNAPYLDYIVDARYVELAAYDAVVDISSVCIRYEHSGLPVLNRIDIFARAAGIPRLVQKRSWYKVEEAERTWAKAFINKTCGQTKIVFLHTASMEGKRCWPVKKYIQIVEEALKDGLDCKFLIMDFNKTFNDWAQYSNCVDVSFTSLRQMAALIEASDLFIGPDSGPMHLAGALETRSIVAFGSIDPAARINYYPTHEAIRMDSLSWIGCWYKPCPYNVRCMAELDFKLAYVKIKKRLYG